VSGPGASVVAQAKLNLLLRVLARETSGYHQLETLFCRLDLGDAVRIRATDGRRSLDIEGVPPADLGPVERNLAWRAALAFADETGWPRGFAITIEKRIPVGGGLGGGSADAGAVLRLLNSIAPTPLAADRLLEVAGSLGADVPFQTQELSPLCFGWGRGDRLTPLSPLRARPCLLMCAPFGVSTPDAYRWLAESARAPAGPAMLDLGSFGEWGGVERASVNTFEEVVFGRVPQLRAAWEFLSSQERPGGPLLRMTGSGATLFALGSPGASKVDLRVPRGFTGLETRTATSVSAVEREA
jgi:4-diphosphocytidyl-2-C-methyl-D-erythritol kinase